MLASSLAGELSHAISDSDVQWWHCHGRRVHTTPRHVFRLVHKPSGTEAVNEVEYNPYLMYSHYTILRLPLQNLRNPALHRHAPQAYSFRRAQLEYEVCKECGYESRPSCFTGYVLCSFLPCFIYALRGIPSGHCPLHLSTFLIRVTFIYLGSTTPVDAGSHSI